MANESANPNISEIQTKNGSVYDVAAKRFSGNRTIEFNGDVTANETGWDGSGKLEVSTTIADGAVGEGKIADSAVTNAKVADGAVNWDKIASSVKNGTIAGNYTEKLATCAQVKTYVDEAITGHGSYLGQKSVAEVNALTGMNNGDHVSVSDAGSITNPDGTSTSVNAGDNVIYDGTLRKWDCLAGDYKVKQTAKELENTDSTKTISKVTQNENGEVSVTYQTIGKVATAGTADSSNKVNVSEATAGSWYNVVGASGTGDKSLVDTPKIVYQYSTNDGCTLGLGDATTSGNSASGKLILASSNANARHLVYSGATTSKILSLGDKAGTILVESDVTSTYSTTGTQAVNGTAVKSAFDNYVASYSNNRWIGCISTSSISGGSQYWPLVKFRVSGDYWDIQFQISRTNRQFDDANFETDNISISGYESNTDGQLKVGRIAFGSEGRGYGTNFYQEHTTTGTGSDTKHWHTIYIKADWSANLYQYCRLDKVVGFTSVDEIQWLSYNTAQTQPTTPLKATYIYPRVSSEAIGSSSVPVYVSSNGEVKQCGDSLDVSISGTASKVSVGDNVGNAIPLVATYQNKLYNSWINQYHDSSNGVILCIGEWGTNGTEKAQLRLRKAGNTATIENKLITESRVLDIPDASGTIALTSDIAKKRNISAELIDDTDDIVAIAESISGSVGVHYYYWVSSSKPTGYPSATANYSCLMEIINRVGYQQINCYCDSINRIWFRKYRYNNSSGVSTWSAWENIYYSYPALTASDIDALWDE